MITLALICAGLAAVLHVYIFVMESVTWATPRTRAVFGTTADEAQTTQLRAFNQGFYNLFLAVITGAGTAAIVVGHRAVGAALVFAGVGSMLAAAFVLIASSRDMTRSAVIQGFFPLIAVALLALGIAA